MTPSDKTELLDLAEMLERKAKWADARKAMAAHDQTINPQKEAQHAAYCRRKAEVCIRAAGPQPRNKTLATAPTAQEWADYAAELKWPVKDSTACFDHFQSNGWRIGGVAPLKDWKAAARNGHRRWLEKNPSKDVSKTGDPDGWKEFVSSREPARKYVEFKYAPDWLKSEFGRGSE